MKKKLVAIAVAGLLAAPLAQAQTANVTLYGRINMDIETVSSATDDGLGELQRVSSNASRIGFKGTESLGGGLNAIFQIESQFAGDSGGGTLASRDTWLGLQGNWGTVKLGHMLTPYDEIHAVFGNAPTFTTSILNTGAIWAQGGMTKQNGGFDARLGNSIRYDSPTFAGFRGAVQYTTDEQEDNGWVGSAGVHYNNAGLQVSGVYEYNKDFRANGLDDQAFTVSAAYNFGVVRPALVYEYLEYEVAGGDKLKRDMVGGSLTVPIGPGTLYGAYLWADKGRGADGARVGNVIGGKDTGAQLFEVSYSYPLSKRTVTYVGYVYIDNDDKGAYTFGTNGHGMGVTPGTDQQGLIIGAVHFF